MSLFDTPGLNITAKIAKDPSRKRKKFTINSSDEEGFQEKNKKPRPQSQVFEGKGKKQAKREKKLARGSQNTLAKGPAENSQKNWKAQPRALQKQLSQIQTQKHEKHLGNQKSSGKKKLSRDGSQSNGLSLPLSLDQPTSDLSQLGGTGVTALQNKMRSKLIGARLRWINERLYTSTGNEAEEMMKTEPALFQEYHQSFAQQTEGWPASPIEIITQRIRKDVNIEENCLIVDLGSGAAPLAKALVPEGYKILSYDLVQDEFTVKAQCTMKNGVPLPGGGKSGGETVDIVVCSLSLMGTDWLGMIQEAERISKRGAKLVIAEVSSRMDNVDEFVNVVEQVGWRNIEKDSTNTHFTLFWFIKDSKRKKTVSEELIEKSKKVLKPCLYKKR